MKLQIKTLAQKTLLIDIEESKTVYDLKRELSLYPDIGVKPELQKIIYAGKIMQNNDLLSEYKIDIKKFLVVMVLKQPLPEELQSPAKTEDTTKKIETAAKQEETSGEEGAKAVAPAAQGATAAATTGTAAAAATDTAKSENEEMVERIVSMGYDETAVRHALAASYNNAERAIEYLIEGTPLGVADDEEIDPRDYDDMDASEASPFEVFRNDPVFRQLRGAIQQHPELITAAIQRIGDANPSILNLINENQQEFLNCLMEASDNDSDDDDDTR